jgi:hypothetical protein
MCWRGPRYSTSRQVQTSGTYGPGINQFGNTSWTYPPAMNQSGQTSSVYRPATDQVHLRRYVSEEEVPCLANTSLWVMRLHQDVSYEILFKAIRNAGPVKGSYIINSSNKPKYTNSAAARITFFSRKAAEKFMDDACYGRLVVLGLQPSVRWHLNRTAEEPAQGRSRVLRISGDPLFVNEEFLAWFWGEMGVRWDADKIVLSPVSDWYFSLLYYYFAGCTEQAEPAFKALKKYIAPFVTVYYCQDPCGNEMIPSSMLTNLNPRPSHLSWLAYGYWTLSRSERKKYAKDYADWSRNNGLWPRRG